MPELRKGGVLELEALACPFCGRYVGLLQARGRKFVAHVAPSCDRWHGWMRAQKATPASLRALLAEHGGRREERPS